MTDLSQMSDADLQALYHQSQGPDVGAMVTAEAQRQGVDPSLALSVARRESGLRTNAVSPKGAMGPMQLMPGTARDLGVDPNDPAQNVRGGVTYLKKQLDRFGDPKLALAAYNAGPGAVQRAGGVPNYPETQAYVKALAPADDLSKLSDADLQALYAQTAPPPPAQPQAHDGAITADVGRGAATGDGWSAPTAYHEPPGTPQHVNQAWGFQQGVAKPFGNLGNWLVHGAESAGLDMSGIRTAAHNLQQAQAQADAQDPTRQNARPGKIGEFAGNIAGTSWLPGGPLVQGGASGALLSDAKDLPGVLRDAAVGAVTGKAVDKGLKVIGDGAQALLGKAPKVMSLPELKTAVDGAYDKVRAAGITIPTADAQALAGDVEALIRSKGGPKAAKLYGDADALAARLKALASQKGGVPISQLEELRGDIYSVLVKPGGKESTIGVAMRQKIDALMDTVAAGNPLLREARQLNARWKKADLVNRQAQSGELRAEKDYGGDFGRKVKDRVFPLIDPANPQRNLRGATADERAALTRLATGTKVQNLASTVGGMLDPRRLGGKIMTGVLAPGGGAAAPVTGGLSLLVPAAQMAAGFGLTGLASSTARRNVDDLLRLIAAGGSRAALKKAPTKASRAFQAVAETARPAAGLIGGAAAAHRRAGP